jgi:hypothetical protein
MQSISASTLQELANFVSISESAISFETEEGTVSFDIVYPPGRFCLTCGEKLPNAGQSAEAEAENAAKCREHCESHGDAMVVEPKWPNGYRHSPKTYLCKIQDSELTQKLMAAGA